MQTDLKFMRRALLLAGRGYTLPNPMVGCVIVKDGVVVGEGWHPAAGEPHAEVFALRAAGELARGADVYVTLEPCCHHGRTPPCTQALITAGVKRVIVGTRDADVRVKDQGLEVLAAAGIEVTSGVLHDKCREINRAFFHFHEIGRPYVTLKCAMSLDGRIATHSGKSQWITGQAARTYVHEIRARSGAVIAGINTLLKDDARLDARLPNNVQVRQPLRVVVDSHLRLPASSAAVRLARENPETHPLLIATTRNPPDAGVAALAGAGVEIAALASDFEGRVGLHGLMALLAERKVASVFCEGGAQLAASLLVDKLANEAMFFMAPMIIGGRSSPGPVGGIGVESIAAAWHTGPVRVRKFGSDLLLQAKISY